MKLVPFLSILMANLYFAYHFMPLEAAEAKPMNIIKSGKDTYKLQTKVIRSKSKNKNLGRDRDDQILEILYSKNNKNIACKGLSDGDLRGCNISTAVKSINLNNQFIGWNLAFPIACGASRYHAMTLVVQVRWPLAKDWAEECRLFLVSSKMNIAIDQVNSFMRIWYTAEEGAGASEYYPTKIMLLPLGDEQPNSHKNLPNDFNKWPKFEYSAHNYFPEVYMAGYLDRNDEVMIEAVKQLFDPKDVENYKYLNLPTTQKDAVDAAKAMKLLDDIGMFQSHLIQ